MNTAQINRYLVIIILCLVILNTFKTFSSRSSTNDVVQEDIPYLNEFHGELEELALSEIQPKGGKYIFFHETSFFSNLNAKQACAIESAAYHNPNHDIFVMVISPLFNDKYYINLLTKTYSNVRFRQIDIVKFSEGTPTEEWIKKGVLFKSRYLAKHLSDYLRLVTLYKFGGMYLDLDVVVKRDVTELGENFVANDWNIVINGAVMHMHNYGAGRNFTAKSLALLIKNFKGDDFIENGPRLLTNMYEEICKTKDRKLWTRERCEGVALQQKEKVYPYSWGNYINYFQRNEFNEAMNTTKNSVMIHVWNDKSFAIWNHVQDKPVNAYQATAKDNCPVVYSKASSL